MWGEVEDKPRMFFEPLHDVGMFVGGIVVDDDMDRLFLRHSGLDDVQKPDELLMAMALHALADDLALKDIERCEQGRDAVALVIMSHGASAPLLHRQPGLATVKRLNLALLIDRHDDGVVGRIDVEADDLVQFGGKLRIVGQLELTHPVRLEAMSTPDPLHRADAVSRPPSPSPSRSSDWPPAALRREVAAVSAENPSRRGLVVSIFCRQRSKLSSSSLLTSNRSLPAHHLGFGIGPLPYHSGQITCHRAQT